MQFLKGGTSLYLHDFEILESKQSVLLKGSLFQLYCNMNQLTFIQLAKTRSHPLR